MKVEHKNNNKTYPYNSIINSATQIILESTIVLFETDINSSITYKVKIYNSLDRSYIYTTEEIIQAMVYNMP